MSGAWRIEAKGRVPPGAGEHAWLEQSFADDGIQPLPLSPEIAVGPTRPRGSFHRDPADRILPATARAEGADIADPRPALPAYGHKGHLHARKI